MTQLEIKYCWTLQIGEGIDTSIILVLIQIGIMIVIIIILTRGVVGDISRSLFFVIVGHFYKMGYDEILCQYVPEFE